MTEFKVLPDAKPFFFEGNQTGVLVSHGFTGTTQSMRFLGEYLHNQGGFTVSGPRLAGMVPTRMIWRMRQLKIGSVIWR